MSKGVEDLLTFLKGSKDAWAPTISTFPEIDVRQLAGDLELERKARERKTDAGAAVLDQDGNDLAELELAENIRQRARLASNDYVTQMDLYEARLRDAAVDDAAFVRIKSIAEQALTNFQAQTAEDRLPLASEAESFRSVKRHFQSFVRRNRLEDVAPVVRSQRDTLNGWLWVAAIVGVETILNGSFFAMGSELGLVGGVIEALVLSILNIALATVLGLFGLRYARHAAVTWKVAGIVASVATVVGVLALNLLIAHYREAFIAAAAAGGGVDFTRVISKVWEAPWSVQEAKSWMLGALGVVLNLMATWKIYGILDPYPGFGKLAGRLEGAALRYSDLQREVIQVLSDHRDAALDEMNQIIDAVSARRHEFEVALRGRERLRKLFDAHLDGLERAASQLRQIYRSHAGLGMEGLRPLKFERPAEVLTTFGADDGSHQRAIETMSGYIDRISGAYRLALEAVGPVEPVVKEFGDAGAKV